MSTATRSHVGGLIDYIKALVFEPQPRGYTPTKLPFKAQMPHVTVIELSAKELENLVDISELTQTIMQVSCWSKDYSEAFQVREAIKANTLYFSGPVLNSIGTDTGLVIQGVNHVLDTELWDSDRELHQLITRYKIWWEYTPSA